MNRGIKYSLIILLSLFSSNGLASDEKRDVSKAQYELHQMWALSRNYYYGTTIPKDKVMALAWQLVYLSVLPQNYPGSTSAIDDAKKEMSDAEIEASKNQAQKLKDKYNLHFQLTERELFSVFNPKQDTLNDKRKTVTFKNIGAFLLAVKNDNLALYDSYQKQYHNAKTHKKYPIVYGKLELNAPIPLEAVSSNQRVDIDKHGYFLITGVKSPLTFQLSGYTPKKATFTDSSKEVNLSVVPLTPLSDKKKAKLTGFILPAKAILDTDIVLKLKHQAKKNDPWFDILETVTALPSGQFTASNLSPTDYELVIAYKDKKIRKHISLKPGREKRLPVINLES